MKIYLDGFFYQLSAVPSTIFYDYTTIPNDCDIIGISFYNSDWDAHTTVINELLLKTNKLLVNLSEPTNGNFEKFIQQLNQSRIFIFSDVVFNTKINSNFSTIVSWFIYPENFYTKYNWAKNRLNRLTHNTSKPFMFDCLLGQERRHRNIINRFYNQSLVKQQIMFSYFKDNSDISLGYWDDDIDQHYLGGNDCDINPNSRTSQVSRYALLPVTVYNQSHYSIVAETTFNNTYNQYTEKVAKPILAKRLFVVFAGQYYLKNLKTLGFKTFNNVIDESYDCIDNLEDRMCAAWEQVEWLCHQDPQQINQEISDILEFNKFHFLENDWHSAIRLHL